MSADGTSGRVAHTADRASIVVAGGHSAGHIEPALAVADAVRRLDPDAVVTALGTVRGLDTTLIPVRGYPLELIPPVPLPRRPDPALLRVPGRVRASVAAAGGVLDRVQADVVIGFGGYVALPAYLAARRRGTALVVHEANARPGLANRVGARLTRSVYTASAAVKLPHAQVVGIPLRPVIADLDRPALRDEARTRFGLDGRGPVLLVTGGSQGAQSVNATVTAALPALLRAGVQILHVVGPKNALDAGELQRRSALAADGGRYVAVPFVESMQYAYAAADLVLCRSGAMTCAELAAVGLPAVFVPLPLRNGEQRLNAEPVVSAGGGLLVADADFTAGWVAANVVPLLTDPVRLARMAGAAAGHGNRHADDVLARVVLGLAGRKTAP
ncbi:MAG: UDP-N-acetylglucosamine--N-acetylmuramyl-(pentapeptide) pyrophosphoryl-undecaprenol N-acetylglucosamine transferase [bacterium]